MRKIGSARVNHMCGAGRSGIAPRVSIWLSSCAVVAAVLGGLVGAAAEGAAQTIDQALIGAYRNNPTLLAERARLRATDETVAQALAGWRPNVTATTEYGKAVDHASPGQDSGRSGTNRDPRQYRFNLDQNVWRGGTTEAGVSRAKNQVDADRARLFTTEQTVLQQAATAFLDVARDQAVVDLTTNQERVLERHLEATRDRFRVGEVTRTDVAQAESRLERARAERVRAQGTLISSQAQYRSVVGESLGILTLSAPLTAIPRSDSEATALAMDRNFNVLRAKALESVARYDVDSRFGELMPQITVAAEYQERWESSTPRNQLETAQALIRGSIPIYEGGSTRARVREGKEIVTQRRSETGTAQRNAVQAATKAWASLQTGKAQIEAFTAGVQSSTIALEGVRQEALVGSRTVLDVLDAEQELLDARVNLVRAQRDEVVATYDLKVAIGELTVANLNLPVEVYDPIKHYDDARSNWFGTRIENE